MMRIVESAVCLSLLAGVVWSSDTSPPPARPTWGRSGRPAKGAALLSIHDAIMDAAEDHTRAPGVKATASTTYAKHVPAQAIDGSLATSWVAAQSRGTFTVDLGRVRTTNAVAWFRMAAGGYGAWGPEDYRVDTSTDGTTWRTVRRVAGHRGPDRIDYFDAVQARHVRLVVTKIQDGGRVAVAEFRVLHVPERPPPTWRRPDRAYRLHLAPARDATRIAVPGVWSVGADPGETLTKGQYLDPAGFVVVAPGAPADRRHVPCTWIADDRYDGQAHTRGRVALFVSEAPRGGFDLYYNAPEKKPKPCVAPLPGTIAAKQTPGHRAIRIEITDPQGVSQVLAFDDRGRPLVVARDGRGHPGLDNVPFHHACCIAYRNRRGRWVAAWIRPDTAADGKVGFHVPRATYVYGEPLQTELTPHPPVAKTGAPVQLEAWLEDVRTGARYDGQRLPVKPGLQIPLEFSRILLTPGRYALCAELASGGRVLRAGHVEIVVVPSPKVEAFFQLWAIPSHSRPDIDTWLPRCQAMGFNSISLKTWRPLDYVLDRAPRYGVTVMPSSVVSACLPRDGQRRAIASSGDPVTHPQGQQSLIHPDVRAAGGKRLVKEIKAVVPYPGFSGYMEYFDDRLLHAGQKPKGAQRNNLADYSSYTLAQFKKKHGRLPPRVDELKVPPPGTVIPDDDPWLSWIVFRCDDYYAGFARALVDAKRRVAPEVKISPVHGIGDCYYRPAFGVSVPYDMGAVDYIRSYHYTSGWPRWRRPNLNFIFQTEMGRVGNRAKESFLLGGSIGGSKVAPGWLLTNKVACLLAAGQNHVALATYVPWYDPSVTVWDVPEAREALARAGQRIARLAPVLARRRFAPKQVALLVSLSTSAYTDVLNEHHTLSKHRPGLQKAYSALLLAGIPAELVDETEVLAGRLAQYKAVVLVEVDYLRKSVHDRLAQFARNGRLLIADKGTAMDVSGARRYEHFGQLVEALRARIDTDFRVATPGLVVRRFLVGQTEYLFAVNALTDMVHFGYEYAELWELNYPELGVIPSKGPARARAIAATLTMRRPGPVGAAYDLTTGRRIAVRRTGTGCAMPVHVAPAASSVIVLHAAPLGSVTLDAPASVAPGQACRVEARVLDEKGHPMRGSVLVRLDVLDPAGRADRRFSRYAMVAGGRATWDLHLAENEPSGVWRVRLRALATGATAEATVTVAERPRRP